ncbi:MAG: hypothetical protein K8T25_20235 [Planctomycetia bacterium]|nr:hypothetical protein [Planctomycetia bacterium]
MLSETVARGVLTAAEARKVILSGAARSGMKVTGVLDLSTESGAEQFELPEYLDAEVLDLRGQRLPQGLPPGLKAYELLLGGSGLERLPDDIQVACRIDLSGSHQLKYLPPGLTVGSLVLRGCSSLTTLPEDLDVWFLDLTGCWAFCEWPDRSYIRSGQLALRGCTAITQLPSDVQRLSWLDVRDCPNLCSLPQGLQISGWLDIAHSGLASGAGMPKSLADVQLRWAGVNVDRRIAFHPEEIRVDEILNERNAERKRALLDRYGYPRFLKDAGSEVVDADTDPGGIRELLRIKMEEDEDLVALSCHCPSTGRQYIIRVPPATVTCRQAAAWIAGFENPDDYRPLVET